MPSDQEDYNVPSTNHIQFAPEPTEDEQQPQVETQKSEQPQDSILPWGSNTNCGTSSEITHPIKQAMQDYESHGLSAAIVSLAFGALSIPGWTLKDRIVTSIEPHTVPWFKKHPRLMKSVASIGILIMLWQHGHEGAQATLEWLVERTMASVEIPHTESSAYRSVKQYVLQQAFHQSKSVARVASSYSNSNGWSDNQANGWSDNQDDAQDDGRQGLEFESHTNFAVMKHEIGLLFFTDDEQTAKLYCLGRSNEKLIELVQGIHQDQLQIDRSTEIVVHVAEMDNQGRFDWEQKHGAHHRSLASVCLPAAQKKAVITHVENFLSTESRRYYSNIGRPRRTGFLLYGKPGCGKTSFAMALATEYNLTVRCISLKTPGMNDSVLAQLVSGLGDGDLLLFEDIDSAGLKRETGNFHDETAESSKSKGSKMRKRKGKQQKRHRHESDAQTSSDDSSDESTDEEHDKAKTAKIAKTVKAKPEPPEGVTLSGMLNAIDGVLTPTGFMIIMTTNNKEQLDKALIRKGRINKEVEFGYACHEQVHDMFLRIYTPYRKNVTPEYEVASLPKLATKFAKLVPEDTVSPAAVQLYLLEQNSNPQLAFDNITELIGASPTVEDDDDLEDVSEDDSSNHPTPLHTDTDTSSLFSETQEQKIRAATPTAADTNHDPANSGELSAHLSESLQMPQHVLGDFHDENTKAGSQVASNEKANLTGAYARADMGNPGTSDTSTSATPASDLESGLYAGDLTSWSFPFW